MYRLLLALRYVAVRPISWISMIGIWLTVTSAIVTLAIFTGFLREVSGVFRGESGDVVVTPSRTRLMSAQGPVNFAMIESIVRGAPGVVAASPHLVRPVLLRLSRPLDGAEVEEITERNFGELIGIDPVRDAATTDFARYVAAETKHRVADPSAPFEIDRASLSPDARDLPVVLAGAGLYEYFGLRKGEVIELSTLPEDVSNSADRFEPLVGRFVVGGAVRCGHYKNDLTGLYIDLGAAMAFAKPSTDFSEICVRAEPGSDPNRVAESVASALERARIFGLMTAPWRARHANDIAAIESQRGVLVILLFFFVLVACFNVFATMTILVTDKIRDIGILAAMGASPGGILALFVGSGFAMALVSSVLGSATGALLAHEINTVHDWIWELTGVRLFNPDVYFFDRIPIELESHVFPLIVVATVAFAVMCAAIPALRAARLDPVRALRQE